MHFLKVAFRNVLRHRTKTILLCIALGFSLFITILATSLSLGFVENAYANITGLYYGNIMLWNFKMADKDVVKLFDGTFDTSAAIDNFRDAVRETTKRTSSIVRLVFNGQESTQQVFGVDWDSETILKQRLALKEGRIEDILQDEKALVISNDIAQKLKIHLGDRVLIMIDTIKGQGNVIECTVRGISYDIWMISAVNCFAHLSYVNRALDIPVDGFNEYNIILKDPSQTSACLNKITEYIAGLQGTHNLGLRPLSDVLRTLGRDVRSWEDYLYIGVLSQMFPLIDSLLTMIQIASYLLMAIMLFITGVGIANSLQLIITERIREIGTMRSIGAKKKWISTLFLTELSIIAASGVIGAVLLYLITMIIANSVSIGQESSLFLFCRNGKITFNFILLQQLLNIVTVFLVTLLSGLAPVRRAAELNPIEALRH